jgi:hypothetical protein
VQDRGRNRFRGPGPHDEMDSPHYGSAADSMATERFCYECSFVLTAPSLQKRRSPDARARWPVRFDLVLETSHQFAARQHVTIHCFYDLLL